MLQYTSAMFPILTNALAWLSRVCGFDTLDSFPANHPYASTHWNGAYFDIASDLKPDAIYLTHYAQIRDVPRILKDLHRLIDAHVEMARKVGATGVKGEARQARLMDGMAGIILGERDRHGWRLTAHNVDFWSRVETFLDRNLKNVP